MPLLHGRPLVVALGAVLLAVLAGGGLALGDAWLVGAFDEETQPAVERLASTLPASPARGLTVQEIYRRSAPAVVQITIGARGAVFGGGGPAGPRVGVRDRQGWAHRHELPRRRGR
jgi:hypothetical protein